VLRCIQVVTIWMRGGIVAVNKFSQLLIVCNVIVALWMTEQQPNQFLPRVTTGTDDGNFGLVHDVKSNLIIPVTLSGCYDSLKCLSHVSI